MYSTHASPLEHRDSHWDIMSPVQVTPSVHVDADHLGIVRARRLDADRPRRVDGDGAGLHRRRRCRAGTRRRAAALAQDAFDVRSR